MTLPGFVFGFLLSGLIGSLFHLWRGGSLGRLGLYLVLSWAGFFAGHFAGANFGWDFLQIGTLFLGPAVIGCLIFLAAGFFLAQPAAAAKAK